MIGEPERYSNHESAGGWLRVNCLYKSGRCDVDLPDVSSSGENVSVVGGRDFVNFRIGECDAEYTSEAVGHRE